jgi:hypothetical protein
MTWTTEEYNAIKAAYKSGVTKVKYADKETEYRSLADMKALIREAERYLGISDESKNRTFATTSKGF